MSSTEAELGGDKQSQEEPDVTRPEKEEIQTVDKTQNEEKPSLEALPNASVLSASEIRGPTDETTVEASPSNAGGDASGEESEAKEEKETTAMEQTSNGAEEGWEDVLGNGQLVKKVCPSVC